MSCKLALAYALGLVQPWQDSDEHGLARVAFSRLEVGLIMSKLATGSNLTSIVLNSCYVS